MSRTSAVLSCIDCRPRLVVAVRPRLISASSITSSRIITRLKTRVLAKLMNLPTPTRKLQTGFGFEGEDMCCARSSSALKLSGGGRIVGAGSAAVAGKAPPSQLRKASSCASFSSCGSASCA